MFYYTRYNSSFLWWPNFTKRHVLLHILFPFCSCRKNMRFVVIYCVISRISLSLSLGLWKLQTPFTIISIAISNHDFIKSYQIVVENCQFLLIQLFNFQSSSLSFYFRTISIIKIPNVINNLVQFLQFHREISVCKYKSFLTFYYYYFFRLPYKNWIKCYLSLSV